MKIKIILEWDISQTSEDYEKYWRKHGVLWDDVNERLYYEADIPFMPVEGQRLSTRFGLCLVEWAMYNVDGNSGFLVETTIVVNHE